MPEPMPERPKDTNRTDPSPDQSKSSAEQMKDLGLAEAKQTQKRMGLLPEDERIDAKMLLGTPKEGSPEDIARQQGERAAQEALWAEQRRLRESAVGNLLEIVKTGGKKNGKEALKGDEAKETLLDYKEALGLSWEGLVHYAFDARTRFNPQVWPIQREEETINHYRRTLETYASVYAPEEDVKDPAVEGFVSRLGADFNRLEAFAMMVEHAMGPMTLYYEGKFMQAILATGRRIKVMSTDDMRRMFNPLKDPNLKTEGGPGKEVAEKLKDLPKEMQEGISERLKQNVAEMLHFEMAISSMNQFKPEADDGKEMPIPVSEVKRQFIASLFKRMAITDELGNKEDLRPYRVLSGDETEGSPKATQELEMNGKKFWINTLSYYSTVRSETELKRYKALMEALVLENAFFELKSLPENMAALTADPKADRKFTELLTRIDNRAKEIVEKWDSPRKPFEQKIASWAFELSFMFNVATLNIADMGHYNSWDIDQDTKNWYYVDDVGNPDMALDAVNAMFVFLHEVTYRMKGRVATPLIPPTERAVIEDTTKYVAYGGRDKEMAEKLEKEEGLARGAGIIGLYEDRLETNKYWLEGKAIRDKLGMEFNPDALKALEATLWGIPTAYSGKFFPMPMKPFYESVNLLKALSVSKKTTLYDQLREGKLITEIDLEKYHPFVADGWQASGKMIIEIVKMLWGRADPKEMDAFFNPPIPAMGELIKWLDIGTRYETVHLKDVVDSKGKPMTIAKEFYEITASAYMIAAYLSFYAHGVWDRDQWRINHEALWGGTAEKKGLRDFMEAAFYLPENKLRKYPHYRDSEVLLLLALYQWVANVANEANSSYEKIISEMLTKMKPPK